MLMCFLFTTYGYLICSVAYAGPFFFQHIKFSKTVTYGKLEGNTFFSFMAYKPNYFLV